MQELALDEERVIKQAQKDKMAVEVQINQEYLNTELYKPNALDGFKENTKFKPELTGKPYGLTNAHHGFEQRPELSMPQTASSPL